MKDVFLTYRNLLCDIAAELAEALRENDFAAIGGLTFALCLIAIVGLVVLVGYTIIYVPCLFLGIVTKGVVKARSLLLR